MTGDVAVQPEVVVRPTPTVLGYLTMYLVAAAVAPVPFVLAGGLAGEVVFALLAWPVGVVWAALYGLPVGILTMALCHLALRHDPRQGVHVAAYGAVATLVTMPAFAVVTGEVTPALLMFGLVGGASAAIGRLAVSGERWRVHPTADWMRELHR